MSLNNGFSLAGSKMRNFLRHDKKGPRWELLRRRKIKSIAQAHHPCTGEDGDRFIKRMPMRWHFCTVSMSGANDVWGACLADVSTEYSNLDPFKDGLPLDSPWCQRNDKVAARICRRRLRGASRRLGLWGNRPLCRGRRSPPANLLHERKKITDSPVVRDLAVLDAHDVHRQ